jgi:hypothetical protein
VVLNKTENTHRIVMGYWPHTYKFLGYNKDQIQVSNLSLMVKERKTEGYVYAMIHSRDRMLNKSKHRRILSKNTLLPSQAVIHRVPDMHRILVKP